MFYTISDNRCIQDRQLYTAVVFTDVWSSRTMYWSAIMQTVYCGVNQIKFVTIYFLVLCVVPGLNETRLMSLDIYMLCSAYCTYCSFYCAWSSECNIKIHLPYRTLIQFTLTINASQKERQRLINNSFIMKLQFIKKQTWMTICKYIQYYKSSYSPNSTQIQNNMKW